MTLGGEIRMQMRTLLATLAVLLVLGAGVTACGGEQEDPQVVVPQEEVSEPFEGYKRADGFLESANQKRVVLSMPDGERRVFRVDPVILPNLGLEHLQSHAGLRDIGFRVFYERRGEREFIVGSMEIPPPTG
jgi:hypothetical protein